MRVIRQIPIVQSLTSYHASWLGKDMSAGFAIAAVGLPSAIAYPAIAGLPPEMGLYASIFAAIGAFHFTAHGVRESVFCDLSWKAGLLPRPVTKG